MRKIQKIGLILLIASSTLTMQAENHHLGEDSKPTYRGIYTHTQIVQDSLINIVEDSLSELGKVKIKIDDLTQYTNLTGIELGIYDGTIYLNDNRNIEKEDYENATEEEKRKIEQKQRFDVYSFSHMSKQIKRKLKIRSNILNNKSVNGVILHELIHQYIQERKEDLHIKNNEVFVSNGIGPQEITVDYLLTIKMFIEEGICEYFSWIHGEVIAPKKGRKPKKEYFNDTKYAYEMGYDLSRRIVKKVIDKYGLREGIDILLFTEEKNPIGESEILLPELYYMRVDAMYNKMQKNH